MGLGGTETGCQQGALPGLPPSPPHFQLADPARHCALKLLATPHGGAENLTPTLSKSRSHLG